MNSRGVRLLLVVVAIAALAGAAAGVWRIEQRVASAQAAADAFERDARQAVVALGEWRAAQVACVAEGQAPGTWLTKAAGIAEAVGPKISALRVAAGTAEAQGALESAVEAFASLMQSDGRARDFIRSGQRISASDVIFTESAPIFDRVVMGIDTARGRELVDHAVVLESLRRWELILVGAAAGVALLVILLLVPVPRGAGKAEEEAKADSDAGAEIPAPDAPGKRGGLHLSHDLGDGVVRRAQAVQEDDQAPAPKASPPRPEPAVPAADLDAVADLCSSLARVQDTRELQGLLARAAKALDATGVIVWMPDGPQGTLRPVLAHGYAPLALSRMGIIHPAADNATATAYRTKSVVVVAAEAAASGAVVAPLISSEGCTGAMAVELREGVEATPQVRAVATIVAAQLATMFAPQPAPALAADAAAGNR